MAGERRQGRREDKKRVAAIQEAVGSAAAVGVDAPASLTQARVWPPNPVGRDRTAEETNACIAYIAQDFATGTYIRGVSWRRYAELGKCSPSLAQSWVSAARRQVFNIANPSHVEDVRFEVMSFARNMALAAYKDRRFMEANAHFRLYLDLAGASGKQQINISIGGAPLNLAGLLEFAERVEWFGEAVRQASQGVTPQLPEPEVIEQDPVLQSLEAEASGGDTDGVMRLAGYRVAGTLDKAEVLKALAAMTEWWEGQ